jgi:hypothetical protein
MSGTIESARSQSRRWTSDFSDRKYPSFWSLARVVLVELVAAVHAEAV